MGKIREQKLLYHLTKLSNVESILKLGLLPRNSLNSFEDIADQEIIQTRRKYRLDTFVPFHWFSKNPFDGRVQADSSDRDFALITVARALAERNNWKIIPRHPLASKELQFLDYCAGFEAIDWEKMDIRDYQDPICKSICMAECLSPTSVSARDFYCIYVPSGEIAKFVIEKVAAAGLSIRVNVNENMFL